MRFLEKRDSERREILMSFYFKSFLLLNEKRNLGNGVNIVGFENGIYWLKKLL